MAKFRALQEPDTSVYDAFLEQLAEDTKQYVIAVFKTLTATVPKAIIHAQVRSVILSHKPHLNSAMLVDQTSDDSPRRSSCIPHDAEEAGSCQHP